MGLSLILALGLGAVVLILLALNPDRPGLAATLCVRPGGGDGCEESINDALAMAVDGDVIQVAAGVYVENVFISRTVTLQGGWAPDFSVRDLSQYTSTVLPADETYSVMTVDGNLGDTSLVAPTIDGFEITGGRADLGGNSGGGLKITSSDAMVISNTIRDNWAYQFGGGIYAVSGTLRIVGNRIESNIAVGEGMDAFGGGIRLENSDVDIIDNVIAGNTVSGTQAHGGGLQLFNTQASIQGNLIENNVVSGTKQTSFYVYGGGLQLVESPVIMTDNTIAQNLASGWEAYGGGMDVSDASVEMLGNTVISNTSMGNLLRGDAYAGYGGGVSIYDARVNMDRDMIAGNDATFSGGGIFSRGFITATESVIVKNQATRDGGGVYSDDHLWLDSTTLKENIAGVDEGGGGGIYNRGIAVLHRTVIEANMALDPSGSGGGGIKNLGWMRIEQGILQENSAAGFGGAISNGASYRGADLIVSDSTISDNVSQTYGGCIHNRGDIFDHSVLTVTRSTMAGNFSTLGGGCISNWYEGTVDIQESTFFENTTSGIGGALHTKDQMSVEGSTLSGNRAQSGGGIANEYILNLTNVTISGNQAGFSAGDQGDGGGIWNIPLSGVWVDVVNTLIAGNTDLTPNVNIPDCASSQGGVVSQGYNLVGVVDGCNWTAAQGDQIGNSSFPLDPMLEALSDNGGPTPTHPLAGDSPAIDAGDNAACGIVDQRGVPRPLDGDADGQAVCDIGAFEYQIPSTTAILSDTPDPSQAGEPFTVGFSVAAALGNPIGAVTVTVDDDPASCSGTLVAGEGSCSLSLSVPGTYTLTAAFTSDDGTHAPSSAMETHTVEVDLRLFLPVIR
jgi:hypothetical protein